MPRHYEDFSGKVIDGVFVIRMVVESGGAGKHKKWVCECPLCHEEFVRQSNHLKDKTGVCCQKCAKNSREDLTGRKFGRLTVDRMLAAGKYERTICSCTCDCGATEIIVQANHLKSGETKSCGCLLSYPEEYITTLLTEHKVAFERQKSFPGLKYKNPLRYDFYLPDRNMVIEYNGEQHYRPIEHYGGEKSFRISQQRDKIKRDYCTNNNIGYLVIRYDEDIKEALIKNNIIRRDSLAPAKAGGLCILSRRSALTTPVISTRMTRTRVRIHGNSNRISSSPA